ncbi:MAG: hypothetical protein A2234_04285 [Elusimicrobia bacterium RIFOXYA2_FULL_58_8]|nr:MAG: hypothetical protein A2285_01100 [Elusimicrobia bacterium RIFOXYA12_FULL_57_11]OGS16339.1 MAG: hypothetical protein A2234_04285 [Elusimicrobia bacterium RIFOXYA2_FULL_58_8]
MPLFITAIIALYAITPGQAAQAFRWQNAAETAQFRAPSPGLPADTLDACPKLNALRATDPYPDSPPAVREVSEAGAASLPLPADDLDRAGLLEALRTSLDYWNSRPDSAKITLGADTYTAAHLRNTVNTLIEILSTDIPAQELLKALQARFRVYRASADDGTGKTVITGYYEADIQVSRNRDEKNRYAIHLKPADLVKTTPAMGADFDYGRYNEAGTLVRHYSAQEIHSGALAGRELELVWTEHPARLMLMQIQGSGILRFPDGGHLRAGFNGANGWPFRSVQKILIDCGETPAMSFKDFISYLSSLPADREERLTDLNPRYIFFQARPKESLPYGAIGRPLTPGRSIAIDPAHIPLGLPGLLKTRRPVARPEGLEFREFTRFITTHDTGSAIRGPGRVDLFWGSGATAETEASSMKAPGELYLLVLR